MVQCCFTSTETIRLIRTGSPGRSPSLSRSSWTLKGERTEKLLYEVLAGTEIRGGVGKRETIPKARSYPKGGRLYPKLVFTQREGDYTQSSFLSERSVCSLNILRTVRRTMIRFLTEPLVRRTWFGQFDELYFVLNWLIMRCKLRPELAADAQQTAWSKM